jgi:hypothetical protein
VISDEAVEAAARKLFQSTMDEPWEAASFSQEDEFRERARGILEAATPHMLGEAESEMVNLKRIIALLILNAGGKATVSRRALAELSDETSLETAEDPASDGWVIRVTVPDSGMALGIAELERQRKYAALDAIRELGSDDPNENPYRSQA